MWDNNKTYFLQRNAFLNDGSKNVYFNIYLLHEDVHICNI